MTNGYNLFRKEATDAKNLLLEQYNLVLEEGPLRLQGVLSLFDNEGGLIENYHISIIPNENYPNSFPLVYETGGKLPHNIDWHIYPDGHFCIKSLIDELIICNKGISLLSFIEDQIIPFLFNQKYRELYGHFINERSHGNRGNIESLQDLFKTKNLSIIKKCLQYILSRKHPNRTDMCFCGSKTKYRKCHRSIYQQMSLLPNETILLYLRIISSAIASESSVL